jgi:trehalose synthase
VTLELVTLGATPTTSFDGVLAPAQPEALHAAERLGREKLAGRRVWNVNFTAQGGGVAEMLRPLLGYARGVGVDARWAVIEGEPAFFAVTKRLHNRLHGMVGDGGPLGEAERAIYERALARNGEELAELVAPGDIVMLHDPQTAGLIPRLRECGAKVVWRCHVGLDVPNELAREAWWFLEPYVLRAEAYVFSRAAFVWDELDPARRAIIAPSIDVFAPKNRELATHRVQQILAATGLRAGRGEPGWRPVKLLEDQPLTRDDRVVLQVSRWDSLKDPVGVIQGFAEHVAGRSDAHLVYAGPDVTAVADDPEGATVNAHACELWRRLPPAARARVHLALLPMADATENALIVNALQRSADVVVQKSLAEGFGLTVAEAMWKRRAVVASRIGGIQDQVEHGVSGLLLDDPRALDAFGAAVLELLDDPQRAHALGEAAHERVRDRYLGTHSLLDYLALFERLLWTSAALPPVPYFARMTVPAPWSSFGPMAPCREIHIRATATGAWVVELDGREAPLSWHTNETDAERSAITYADTLPDTPAIVVHDRYARPHTGLLHV